jgi:hypothetical protein
MTPKTASKAAVFCHIPTDRQLLVANHGIVPLRSVVAMEILLTQVTALSLS